MGWELRRGKLYYYKKRRRGDKVTSIYCGKTRDELDVLNAYCKSLEKVRKVRDTFWKAECRENLKYYREAMKHKAIRKDPELSTRAKKMILVFKIYLHPTQYLEKLYFLLVPGFNITEAEINLLNKMAR